MIDLKFDHVSKRYWLYPEGDGDAAKNSLWRRVTKLFRKGKEFWALSDVSFEVERGEAVGIIGHNGAGKTTILKLLFNITAPTRGEITIRGRLSALLEISSGFHPELTGRENVYLNGSLLGMERREITKKLEQIIEFAEIRPFIDVPVKRYSLGMHLRLGFSIAAHLDPDILLLDEILTVGDAPFQAKCLERITGLKEAGKTIVFVSHNLSAVEILCDRVLLVHHGRIVKSGKPREVLTEYEQLLSTLPTKPSQRLISVEDSPPAEVVSISLRDSAGQRTSIFSAGDSVRAELELTVREALEDAIVEVYFYSVFGTLHTHFTTEVGEVINLKPGRYVFEFFCPELGLELASFDVEASIKRRGMGFSEHLDYKRVGFISVTKGKSVHGFFHTAHTWKFKELPSLRETTEDLAPLGKELE